jgi:hypothetical protein
MRFWANRKRLIVSALVIAFMGILWCFWPNMHLARARDLRDRLSSGNLSGEERQQVRGQLRRELQLIPPDQRRNLWRERQRQMLEEYFALSAKDKRASLDRIIEQAEAARAERQQTANKNDSGASQNAPNRRNLSQEERDQRRKARLDYSTPEERVLRHEFFHDLQARRQQLGLPTRGPWGRSP